MTMNQSQQTKPALDIRSLATPKPPQSFLRQDSSQSGRSMPSLISSQTLPSPPFTPIVPLPTTHRQHTQPLHSTPMYQDNDDNVDEITNNKDVTLAKNDAGSQVAEQSMEFEVDQDVCGGQIDTEDSLPSVHVATLDHQQRQKSPSNDNVEATTVNENQESRMDTDSDTSLPSPGYVPLYKTNFASNRSNIFDRTNKGGDENVDQQNKIESFFDLSLESMVSDYPECGNNGVVDKVNSQEEKEDVQVQSGFLFDHGEGPCANDRSLGCTPWAGMANSTIPPAPWISSPRVRPSVSPTGWTTSSPLSRRSTSPKPRISGWSSSQMETYDNRVQRPAGFYEPVHPPGTWSSSSQPCKGTPAEQIARTGWSTSSDSVESRFINVAAACPRSNQPHTPWISSPHAGSRGVSSSDHVEREWSSTTSSAGPHPLGGPANPANQPGAWQTNEFVSYERLEDSRRENFDTRKNVESGTSIKHCRVSPYVSPIKPTHPTLSQRVSQLGKVRSLFSPSLSPHSTSVKSDQNDNSDVREKENLLEKEEERVLSICFAGGYLGAALFNTFTAKLELLKDIPDEPPRYEMLTSLVYQTEPHIILVSARQDQALLESLKHLCGILGSETVSTSVLSEDFGSNDSSRRSISLVLRPGMEFSLNSCVRRVRLMDVPGEESSCEQEQLVKLSAYVDFTCKSMIRAAGALLKYLDKNYRTGMDQDTPMVLFINSLVLEEILSLDEAAFTALQVFSASSQLSGSKAGSWNRKREGLSMLNMLNRCGSVVGSRFMRRMLRCPSANLEVIIHRQQAMAFFTSSGNFEFVQAIVVSIKQIKNFHRIMNRLVSNTMTVSDWQALYRTLGGLVQLAQLSENCKVDVPILKSINNKVCDIVYSLRNVVEQVIDFQASLSSGNLSVKPGVDKELDEKRRLHNALPDLLNMVAQEESKNLPPYMQVCTVCYLPQVGYLIAIPYQKNLEEQGVDFRNIPQLEFVFESNGALHYRNRRTLALDQTMGDVVQDITRIEMGILTRLTEAVLRNRSSIEEAVSLCGQLDCLVALAMVSKENNWSRPDMMKDGDLVITEGRHPLQELSVTNFIANSCWLGGEGGRVHLLTGPNSSGKSVFMKQIGLIVYLAHLGCYVPAQSARIPVMDRILTRIQTVESISLGMSSFLCDITQLSTALTSSSNRSLLLVDEFGKGTTPVDGAALLAATVLDLVSLQQSSPFCVLSSHFHVLPSLLDSHPSLRYFHLETQATTTGLVYLYNVVVGVSTNSHARSVALKAGIQEDLVGRVDQVFEEMAKGLPASLPDSLLNLENIHQLVSCFLDLEIEKEEEMHLFTERMVDMKM